MSGTMFVVRGWQSTSTSTAAWSEPVLVARSRGSNSKSICSLFLLLLITNSVTMVCSRETQAQVLKKLVARVMMYR